MHKKRARGTLLALAITLVCSAACPAGTITDERFSLDFDGREWEVGFANATEEELLVEYVLRGESVEQWTELVTTTASPILPEEGVASFMRDHYRENAADGCSELRWEEVFNRNERIICVWDKESCRKKNEVEYSMTCFTAGVNGVHVACYAARDKSVFEKRQAQWQKIFERAGVFAAGDSMSLGELDAPGMIHAVYRYESSGMAPKSWGTGPREIWRSGLRYMRAEETPDRDQGIQILMVVDEPDAWIANLLSGKGQHQLDPGPTYRTRAPIFGEMREDGLKDLGFGVERAFFEHHGARRLTNAKVNGRTCEVFELPRLYWVLRLYIGKLGGLPVKVTRRGPDGLTQAVCYDIYEVGLPLDRVLFMPPEGIEWQEN